jgi:hypothetical protein
VLAIALLEGATRAYEAIAGAPTSEPVLWRTSRTPPYRDAPYWSPEFRAEAAAYSRGWRFDRATRLHHPPDFAGDYIHSKNGQRATAFQPDLFEQVIHLFGGSTVHCVEVPDTHTIASRMQLRLNAAFPDRFRVENRGYPAVHQRQQIARLRWVSVEPGDVIVFYDGVNDVFQTIYRGKPRGRIVLDPIGADPRWGRAQYVVSWLYTRLGPHLRLVQRFAYPLSFETAAHLLDPVRMEQLSSTLEERFDESLRAADDFARAQGAQFIHFLQPNLFEHAQWTPWEKEILAIPQITRTGFDASFRAGYPALRRAIRSAQRAGVRSFDLSKILTEREAGEDYYLDWAHVNHRANDRVAARIVEVLVEELELGGSG